MSPSFSLKKYQGMSLGVVIVSVSASIISIQSQVVFGHVGNSAGVLAMQLRGHDVAAIPTTLLSNHTGFDTLHGKVIEPELIEDLLIGIEKIGLLKSCRYIVSGYLGSKANAEIVKKFILKAKQLNPDIIYICDPVMGDIGPGLYVPESLADFILTQLAPLADVLTPNHYELGIITGNKTNDFNELIQQIETLQSYRDARIVVTSCILSDTPKNTLENIVAEGTKITRYPSPRIPLVPSGTGDLFTGLLTADLANGFSLSDAVDDAAHIIVSILTSMQKAGRTEIQLGSVIKDLLPKT